MKNIIERKYGKANASTIIRTKNMCVMTQNLPQYIKIRKLLFFLDVVNLSSVCSTGQVRKGGKLFFIPIRHIDLYRCFAFYNLQKRSLINFLGYWHAIFVIIFLHG